MASSAGTARTFPGLQFQRKWRAYQARVLDTLDSYLDDHRLHLSAAPGSGKTILGIEIVRRLDERTLVLVPTITIREQWVDRLVDCFLRRGDSRPAWVSTDLRKPAAFTVATYQAMHALCTLHNPPETEAEDDQASGDGEINHTESQYQVPKALTEAGFKTLVVDEAHHLRAEWWKALNCFVEELKSPNIVALTATPPYDVPPAEWDRYEKLCGPIDTEVSVPELVQAGDLCPHQDYVYFSTPSEQDQRSIRAFRTAVEQFVQNLRGNQLFTETVKNHPWLAFPDDYSADVHENLPVLLSLAIYLNSVTGHPPKAALKLLHTSHSDLPALDLDWLEHLLTHYLYDSATMRAADGNLLRSLRDELRSISALEHRTVTLRRPAGGSRWLTHSPSKLQSIEEIVKLELASQGSSLRMAILADFIRKDAGHEGAPETVGVVPIFEKLRRATIAEAQLGVLSGTLVIVPRKCQSEISYIASDLGIDVSHLAFTPSASDTEYLVLEIEGEHNQDVVRLMTSLFEKGGVNVLVGTKSLLGEGWDAPCINSLILATFVSSFVLSNQIRGRSIRVRNGHPEKTANIWHLVCIEPESAEPGEDYELLIRRSRGFVGLSATGAEIESGSGRLALPKVPLTNAEITALNARSVDWARDRDSLRERWQLALAAANDRELAQGLKTPESFGPREFVLRSTVGKMMFQAGSTFLAFFLQSMREPAATTFADALFYGAATAAVVSSPFAALAGWRLLRHGTPEWSIRRIGQVVLDSLISAGSVTQHFAAERKFRIYSRRARDGSIFCWLGGGTAQEQTAFLRALEELLSPIENPRYLLARKRVFAAFREDYFAVPEILGRNKRLAEEFAARWSRSVSPVDLLYTHTPEGRTILLRARAHALAGRCQPASERMSRWV